MLFTIVRTRHFASELGPGETALPSGKWTASVDSAEHTHFHQRFAVLADDEEEAHVLRLRRGARLRGVVRDHQGERATGARVWLGQTETTTDTHGVFRLDRVKTGDVILRAKLGGEDCALPLGLFAARTLCRSDSLPLGLFAGDELVTLTVPVHWQRVVIAVFARQRTIGSGPSLHSCVAIAQRGIFRLSSYPLFSEFTLGMTFRRERGSRHNRT